MYRTCRCQSVQLMCDQNPGGACQQAANAAIQQVPSHVRVHRRQRVVQQHDVGASIARASQRHALPLPATQVYALLADLSFIACTDRA